MIFPTFAPVSDVRKNINIQRWVLLAGGIILIAKFIAFWITNSNAILTDALESIINVLAGSFALFSLIFSSKPRDRDHPYGHGKVEFLSAALEGSLIVLAGLAIIGKSTYNLFYPHTIQSIDTGMILTVVAGGFNFLLGHWAEKAGKRSDSLTLIAEGKHLKSDTYSTLALLVGLGAIYLTGLEMLDNLVAIGFGLFIGYTGVKILRTSVAGIMDEADEEVLRTIIRILEENRRENWIDFHNMRVIKYGPLLHIDCHLTVPWYLNVKEAHDELEKVEALIDENISRPIELFIHTDPCIPDSCPICQKQDCHVRQHPREKRVSWDLDNVLQNKKHGL